MYLKISEVLYMNINSSDEKKVGIVYKSRITDIEEESFLIEIPMQEDNGQLKRLYLGDELSVYFLTEDGVKHYFNTYVLGFKEDIIRMVRVRKPKPEEISKIQRRTYFRVNANLEIAVQKEDTTRFITQTEDLSGGGLSFFAESKHHLKEGERLSCWVLIHYKNGLVEHIPLKAEIVRIKNSEHNRNIVMLRFTEIFNTERQKLIRYCFERQMDFRDR
ncbi:flagellar brake protein [Paenibacillus sp. FA6]|uniref:flagellar brake protein n=1 Tax=Paenibacillus sp. FA6 TaxID=3413029 RepID=UPI003F655F0B